MSKTTIRARVIATGEIVKVHQAKEGDTHFIDENNNPYKCEELDFNVEEEITDPFDRWDKMLDKLAEINNPKQTYHFPTRDEINESNLKLEKEKFKMEKEKMRLQFMGDCVLKFRDNYHTFSDVCKVAEEAAKLIFDDDK